MSFKSKQFDGAFLDMDDILDGKKEEKNYGRYLKNKSMIEKDNKENLAIWKNNSFAENKIADNNVLLISEVQNKVLLPYKYKDLKKIIDNKDVEYNSIKEIVDDKYTIPLNYYRHIYFSRFKEAYNLMRYKEKASLFDSIDLALELMKNRFVHPAIITACKNLDQLDVYLDCLETNELDDFPFFKIIYELKD